jgi:hypothetical protein
MREGRSEFLRAERASFAAQVLHLHLTMTSVARLSAILLLLSGCDSDARLVDDGTPGPADEFVGVWEGSGTFERSSSAAGDFYRKIEGSVAIGRVTRSAVKVGLSGLHGLYEDDAIYEINPDLSGQLLSGYDRLMTNVRLEGDVLTLAGSHSDGAIFQPTSYMASVTLKRVP